MRPQEGTGAQLGREAVFGVDGQRKLEAAQPAVRLASNAPSAAPRQPVSTRTTGESALLRLAGADQADPQIRRVVDRESAVLAEADLTFLDKLIKFRDPESPGTLLDAEGESQRLRENQALGRPVTEGPTPRIVRKERGLLEGLF